MAEAHQEELEVCVSPIHHVVKDVDCAGGLEVAENAVVIPILLDAVVPRIVHELPFLSVGWRSGVAVEEMDADGALGVPALVAEWAVEPTAEEVQEEVVDDYVRASFKEVCLQAGLPLTKPLVLVGSLEEDLVHLSTDVADDPFKKHLALVLAADSQKLH